MCLLIFHNISYTIIKSNKSSTSFLVYISIFLFVQIHAYQNVLKMEKVNRNVLKFVKVFSYE